MMLWTLIINYQIKNDIKEEGIIMYLFGDSCFETLIIKNIFQYVFIIFMLSELFIFIFNIWSTFSSSKQSSVKKIKGDKGSYFLIVIGFIAIIFLNPICRKNTPFVFPVLLFWIGAILIILGILLRVYSVFTLRNYFTLSVQVNSAQKIIQSGPYKQLRHPAYSGSLLSLIGVAICFRSLLGLLLSLLIMAIIYSYRIKIEEKILENNFPSTYSDYKNKTYKIIPFVW